MTPRLETIHRVIALIDGLGLARINQMEPHSTLEGDLGLDALHRLEIARAEGVDNAAAATWQTIADIARSVERLQAIQKVPAHD